MRIAHLSDTHIGFAAYQAVDKESGINQREADNNNAFRQAVDKIRQLKPDVVLHTGDLFDSVRPNNRNIAFAIEQLLCLTHLKIPVVIICGNHSMPRLRETGNIFQLLELFPNLYPIYKNQYESLQFGDLTIQAIPQCLSKEDFENNLNLVGSVNETKYNALMLHAAVTGVKEFSMNEFNEQLISSSTFDSLSQLTYIALGHYHKYTQVAENAYYAGSLERLSFNEINQEKGFIEIDLAKKEIIFHQLDIRPMIDLPVIDAKQMDAMRLMETIEVLLNRALREAECSATSQPIIRLTIDNLSTPTYNALDFNRLCKLTAPALHFELKFNLADKMSRVESLQGTLGGLQTEFRNYISKLKAQDSRQKVEDSRILQLGLEYLERAGESSE